MIGPLKPFYLPTELELLVLAINFPADALTLDGIGLTLGGQPITLDDIP